MNKFKFIIKGMLLWTTGFVTMFFITGIDSIYDNGYVLWKFQKFGIDYKELWKEK